MTIEEAVLVLKRYQGYEPMEYGNILKHSFDLTDETVDTLLSAIRTELAGEPLTLEQLQHMDEQRELARRMREMAVNTGGLDCLGCGYEHSCGVHGCAVLKRAADLIENQQHEIAALMQANEALRQQQQWISVTERLPVAEDKYGWVNCIVTVLESRFPTSSYDYIDAPESREIVLPAMFDCAQKIWHVGETAVNALMDIEDSPLNGWYVTHWMPLPESPAKHGKAFEGVTLA